MNKDIKFSLIGVSIRFLKEFLMSIEPSLLETATTTDINTKIIIPQTIQQKCSYVDYLKTKESTMIGTASVFISHAWKYKFKAVAETILQHFAGSPDLLIWFDLFCNNQHIAPDLPVEWWCHTFKSAIQSIGHTVMIFAPWNEPIPLTRGWCIWELYCTIDTNCQFEIAMIQESQEAFVKDLEEDVNKILNKMSAKIDCENSQCFKPEDRHRIHEAIRKTVGFHSLNQIILDRIRQWMISFYEEKRSWIWGSSFLRIVRLNTLGELYLLQGSYAKAIDAFQELLKIGKHEDALVVKWNLASAYQRNGNYQKAEKLYEEFLTATESYSDADHTRTFQAKIALAENYSIRGEYEKAEKFMMECLESARFINHGKDHQETCDALMSLADIYIKKHDYAKAELKIQECLKSMKGLYGGKDPRTISVVTSLAYVYKSSGQFVKAISLLQQAAKDLNAALGEQDIRSINAIYALALTHYEMKEYDAAERLFLDCLPKHQIFLGQAHPTTVTTLNNLAALYETQGNFSKAESLYNECLSKSRLALGEDHPSIIPLLNNMALLYERQGNYQKAETLYLDCISRAKVFYGEKDPALQDLLKNYQIFLSDRTKGSSSSPAPSASSAVAISSQEIALQEGNIFTLELVSEFIIKQILTINGVEKIVWNFQRMPIELSVLHTKIAQQEIIMEDDLAGNGYDVTQTNFPHKQHLNYFQRYFPCCYHIEVKSFSYKYFGKATKMYCSMGLDAAAVFENDLRKNGENMRLHYCTVKVEDESPSGLLEGETAKVVVFQSGDVVIFSKRPNPSGNARIFKENYLFERIDPSKWIELNN